LKKWYCNLLMSFSITRKRCKYFVQKKRPSSQFLPWRHKMSERLLLMRILRSRKRWRDITPIRRPRTLEYSSRWPHSRERRQPLTCNS
jgi:hypothetical protein